MKTKILALFVLSAFLCRPVLFAQNASTVSAAGVQEQVIQIEVTPADRAAVVTHRRVHTNGALRPDGGHYPPRTFETDTSGALVEVTRNLSSALPAGQAAVTSASSGAPPFTGYGYYPADVSLLSPSGQTVVSAQVHNVYINCTAECWGNPSIFETNLFSSDFIHIVDQYVGSEANGRYSLGPSLQINYSVKSQSSFSNLLNYADLDAILHAAALKLGSGYNHIFNVFIPKGVDFCDGYAPPYTSCFSPDNPSTWNYCAFHGYDTFSDVPGIVLATLQPYTDVFATVSGQPVYPCLVGGVPPFNTDNISTPNGVLVDSQADDLDHELFETITDPDSLEWQSLFLYFTLGAEVGDLCNPSSTFPFFPVFNVSGHPYEIQTIYSNKYHACVTVP